MKVILTQDVARLGSSHSVVEVAAGYGRNYLIPKGLAKVANAVNLKVAAEDARQAAHKAEKNKKEAQRLLEQLKDISVEVYARASSAGKTFGTISAAQLSHALAQHGIDIDRKHISFPEPVKELGTQSALITLHKDLTHTLEFRVLAS